MPSLAAVTAELESIAPRRLAAEWDAVGLLVSPRRPTIERVMTCLSLTEDVAAEAVRRRADLVVTHHPLPFRPVARLTEDGHVGRVLLALVGAGAGVWSPHTAWDSAAGGINDQLAAMIGLDHVAPLEPDAELPLVGFGRVGPAFWGFATQGLVPDVVTMGKPAGNGHPLAAVVTTPEIAASFANGMEYFNTFGGNPVSAAIGNAVLDVIEDEGLAENAERVGARIMAGMRELATQHELIGDVRGLGLYLGVELVRDRDTLEPADAEAAFVIEACKDLGVLVSIDGPFHNVLKIKPPIVWSDADADRLVGTLDRVLRDPRLGP